MNARDDSGGRNRHARFRNPDALNQQPHRLDEVRIIEEGLAHAHEDEVDAVASRPDPLVLQHGRDLPNNFSGRQVAFDAEQRCQAELTIDGAPDLTGNADRGPIPTSSAPALITGLAAVACLAVVALRHPHGLDALPIGERDQVSHRPIYRVKSLLDAGQADRESLFLERAPELLWEGRDAFGRVGALGINRLEELSRPVSGLAGIFHKLRKLLKIKP